MKRSLIERSDLTGRDTLAFRTKVHRITRASQDAIRALENPAPLFLEPLRHGPENSDDVSDDGKRKKFAQVTGEKKSRARQAERNQEEYIERRAVIRNEDGLAMRERLRIVSSVVNPPDSQNDPADP